VNIQYYFVRRSFPTRLALLLQRRTDFFSGDGGGALGIRTGGFPLTFLSGRGDRFERLLIGYKVTLPKSFRSKLYGHWSAYKCRAD